MTIRLNIVITADGETGQIDGEFPSVKEALARASAIINDRRRSSSYKITYMQITIANEGNISNDQDTASNSDTDSSGTEDTR